VVKREEQRIDRHKEVAGVVIAAKHDLNYLSNIGMSKKFNTKFPASGFAKNFLSMLSGNNAGDKVDVAYNVMFLAMVNEWALQHGVSINTNVYFDNMAYKFGSRNKLVKFTVRFIKKDIRLKKFDRAKIITWVKGLYV